MDLWATVPYYTAYLSKALLSEGIDLTVGSISYYLDPGCFSGRGIRVDPGLVDYVGRLRLGRPIRRVLKFAEAMINLVALTLRFALTPPDVVHVQYLPMLKWRLPLDFWFLEYCRRRGAKIVLTVHDLMPHDTANTHRQTFFRLYGMVDKIICHSDHIKNELHQQFEVPIRKITVIPHGPLFYDIPSQEDKILDVLCVDRDSVIVLWQGIIFPYKGVDLLLEAWQRVEADGLDATLIIAGTGAPDLLNQIEGQVEQLGLKRVKLHFRFISTEELVQLYRAADIVVYPYRAITTSGALATGLALNKTIVASNLQVFRELLTHKENAFLVEAGDAQHLADGLRELLRNAGLRELLTAGVRKLDFGEQSWRSIAEKTIRVYRDESC